MKYKVKSIWMSKELTLYKILQSQLIRRPLFIEEVRNCITYIKALKDLS
jgi:hypothetical protein